MKKIIFFLAIFLFPINALAININSTSLVAMDIDSGRIFYEKNKDEKHLIASTTKIMTAVIAIESNKLTDIVEATEEILTMYGSNIYLEYHEHMLLEDLIYGLMLRSGNDAGVVIAKHVGGSVENFVDLMNKKAQDLGMKNTIFKNPTGLDDDENTMNYSTSYDMAILYKYAYSLPEFVKITSTKDYKTQSDFKSYYWKNRADIVLQYDKCTGGKTGYTPKAGRILASSASNGDLNITIFSINKGEYDTKLHQQIYEDIFYNYKSLLVVDKDNFKLKNNIYDETLYITESFKYPVTKQEEQEITKKIVMYEKHKHPKDKEKVGTLYVYKNDEIIFKTDIFIKLKQESLKTKIVKFFKKIF